MLKYRCWSLAFLLALPGVGAAANSKAARHDTLCRPDETVVFSCRTGAKKVSVCASADASASTGYVQYRFGRPSAVEMTLPSMATLPAKTATGDTETYSGGGSAWLRFRQNDFAYVVYTGIGKWGPKEQHRAIAGVVVEQRGTRIANLNCTGAETSLLGAEWFNAMGIHRGDVDEEFRLPL